MSEERSMTFPSNKKILNCAPKTALSEVIIFIGGNLEMLFKKNFTFHTLSQMFRAELMKNH